MRKKTVKNLCKEIFWHIVYFLPIVIALFSMLLFTTENYANYVVNGAQAESPEDDITDLTGTSWTFNENIVFPDNLSSEGKFVYDVSFTSDDISNISMVLWYDYFGNAAYQLCYVDFSEADNIVYNTSDSAPWSNDFFRAVTFTGGSDLTNVDLINFLRQNAVINQNVVPSSTSVYVLMSDALNSSFDVMGLNFDNDYLYNALKQVFVNGQILAVFNDVSVLLKFATYYFYVHIIHLFIDALLFIPKLAHKWIDSLTRCE